MSVVTKVAPPNKLACVGREGFAISVEGEAGSEKRVGRQRVGSLEAAGEAGRRQGSSGPPQAKFNGDAA